MTTRSGSTATAGSTPTSTSREAAGSTLIRNIGELTTNDPAAGPGLLGTVTDAAMVLGDGIVQWVGRDADAPAADTVVDAAGRAVLPGWVDSHTHLVFAGDRAAEFSARMAGAAYQAGGMTATVTATRAADDAVLQRLTAARLAAMRLAGSTTVEVKTGYGLAVAEEARCAAIAAAAGADAVTFLGAHVVPPEYADRRGDYLDLVCGPMLEAVRPHARFIDVFCESGAFDETESRRVLRAGIAAGLDAKVHGNQLTENAGTRLAVELGAASVDHCTYLADADVAALAGSDTVATLLPAADLSTRQPPAPGRRLVDAGARIALATNCNPGTSYTMSMPLVVALAVLQCELTTAEAVYAATAGGARALRRGDIGALAPGMRADVQIIDAPSVDHIAYRVGGVAPSAVWRAAKRVT